MTLGMTSRLRKSDRRFKSSIKDARLLHNGTISEAPPGKPLTGQAGLNEILVTGPGQGIREIRFWLKSGELKIVHVERAKIKGTAEPDWTSPEKLIAANRFGRPPSVCAWYLTKTNDGSTCHRQSYLEDLTEPNRVWCHPKL